MDFQSLVLDLNTTDGLDTEGMRNHAVYGIHRKVFTQCTVCWLHMQLHMLIITPCETHSHFANIRSMYCLYYIVHMQIHMHIITLKPNVIWGIFQTRVYVQPRV